MVCSQQVPAAAKRRKVQLDEDEVREAFLLLLTAAPRAIRLLNAHDLGELMQSLSAWLDLLAAGGCGGGSRRRRRPCGGRRG